MKSHSKGSPKVWTESEKGDRSCLVVTVQEFERVIIGEDIELFFKRTTSAHQISMVLLLPRHLRVKRSKIDTGE